MNKYCLCCGKPLKEGEIDYHPTCRKKFSVVLENNTLFEDLIDQQIDRRETIPGVQKKISASFRSKAKSRKITIVREDVIIKFPSDHFPYITEMENLCMNMADACHIQTAEHTLLRDKDNQYFYLTKRMDRDQERRIPMEDFCQLSMRLTEDKYHASYESFGELLDRYSAKPIADKTVLFYRLLFCFVTGNNDMHLKNFSLISDHGEYHLSPAYDLLNVMLINTKDPEEMALTVNGKKKNLHKKDFLLLAGKYGIVEKVYFSLVNRLKKDLSVTKELITTSLLSEELKEKFIQMMEERLARL